MKAVLRWTLILGSVFVVSAVVAAVLWSQMPPLRDAISISGDGVFIAGADALDNLEGAPAALAAALAVAAVSAVVLAGLFAIAAVGLAVGIALLAVAVSLLLAAAPFVLVGWLLWLIVRGRARPAAKGPTEARA